MLIEIDERIAISKTSSIDTDEDRASYRLITDRHCIACKSLTVRSAAPRVFQLKHRGRLIPTYRRAVLLRERASTTGRRLSAPWRLGNSMHGERGRNPNERQNDHRIDLVNN